MWKSFLAALAGVAIAALVVGLAYFITRPNATPSGVVISGSSMTPVTTSQTVVPSTTTVTVTEPVLPTESLQTMTTPTPPPCEPNELDPRCWDTDPDSGGVPPATPEEIGEVFDVSPSNDSEHGYDMIVFNVSSLIDVQFDAEYVDPPNRITTEGKGDPVNLFGMADLRLTIRAPANSDLFAGYEYRASMNDYGVLRHIKYAGSFEGQTTFGIGVDHKVPFAVVSGPSGSSGTDKIVVYLAHE